MQVRRDGGRAERGCAERPGALHDQTLCALANNEAEVSANSEADVSAKQMFQLTVKRMFQLTVK